MKHVRCNLLILLGLVPWLAFPALASPGDDDPVVSKGRVKIVVTDEDGTPHSRSYEFSGEGPRAFLGVGVESGDLGVVVDRVISGSGAEQAGLQDGDVIRSVNGQSVELPADLTGLILQSRPGEQIDIEIERAGQRRTLRVELGERDGGSWFGTFDLDDLGELHEHLGDLNLDLDLDQLQEQLGSGNFNFRFRDDVMPFGMHRPKLGVQLVPTTPELRVHLGGSAETGVLVGKVLPGTPAEQAGLQVGDLIVSADGESLSSPGELVHALRGFDGETIRLEIIRNGSSMTVDAFIPASNEADIDLPTGPRA